ncbi:translocation/assembly module TamB domain-containing protein [Marinobacterium rhizophilum]|uniref:translocation/assembly module TamB domain-containing protein n=1 Tax=Marinobacterium rhizophilum TaxID=420402 RepID=UPI00036BE881|nr:translocation/assembly module TamB domain-containing protein [Marinobacterium rhizophilum]
MKRWTLRIVLGLLALLVLLLGAIAAIGLTEKGTRTLFNQLQPLIPGQLSYDALNGALLTRLDIQGLRYQRDDLRVHAGRIEFAWRPAALLSGRLELDRLGVEELDLWLPPAVADEAPSEPAGPLGLPDSVRLPLAVQVGEIYGRGLRIHPAEGEPILIEAVALGAHNELERVILDRFSFKSPQAEVNLSGEMTAAGNYPLAFKLDWSAPIPERGQISGSGTLGGELLGDAALLTLDQQLQGLAEATLVAKVARPLGELSWQLALDLARFDPAPFAAVLGGHLVSGSVNLKGDLASAGGDLALVGSLPDVGPLSLDSSLEATTEQLHLTRAQIQLPQSGTDLSLSGRVLALQGTPELDLALSWTGLRYPLSTQLPAQVASDSGSLNITGPLSDYRLRLGGSLRGEGLPATGVELTGQGSLERMPALALTLDTLGGQLVLEGSAGWTPQPVWDLQLRADKINPGLQWPDWTGAVGLTLNTQGQLVDGEPRAQLDIAALSGRLRDQALSGAGQVQVKGAELDIRQLALGWGNARLNVQGQVAETLALDWQLLASDLAALLPQAAGSIRAGGTLAGTAQMPQINATVEGSQLRFGEDQLAHIGGTVALDLGWKTPAKIDLKAEDLRLAGQPVRSLSLQGSGVEKDHRLTLDVDAQAAQLSVVLDGGLQAQQQWRGTLSTLDITQADAGAWGLQAPVALELSASQARTQALCLRAKSGQGRLCLDGQWRAEGNSEGGLTLQELPLTLLAPWLPATTDITGQINAQASGSFSAKGALAYEAQVSLDQARLTLPDEGLKVSFTDARVSASGTDKKAALDLNLLMDEVDGRVQGSVAVDDLAGAGRIKGQIALAIKDLKFLSLLVPDMKVGSGELQGDLALGGSLAAPRLQGELNLNDGNIELPAAGIALADLRVRLRDDPARPEYLLLDGSMASGGGTLSLAGEFEPLAQTGEIRINGEGFQAVGTPEIQVFISPDMQISMADGRIAVGGELKVPEALIKPPKLSNAVSVSSDAVVVNAAGEPQQPAVAGPALDLNLRVTLGDKVRVDAFGFNGRLEGGLVLQDDSRRGTRATGNIGVASGQYELYGQQLNVSRGSFVYTGGPVDNPGLNMRVEREVDEVTVGARVGGTLRIPKLTLFSEPAMPDTSLLSYLILGRAPGTASASEQEMLVKLALAMGSKGGNAVGERVADVLNVDEVGVGSGDTLDETSLYIGKHLSPRLYVKYGVGLLSPASSFLIRYKLTERWSFESNTSSTGSGADIFYKLER